MSRVKIPKDFAVDPDALAAFDREHGRRMNWRFPDEAFRPGGPAAFRAGEVPRWRWGPPALFDGEPFVCGDCSGVRFMEAGSDEGPAVVSWWSGETGQPIANLCAVHAFWRERDALDGRRPNLISSTDPEADRIAILGRLFERFLQDDQAGNWVEADAHGLTLDGYLMADLSEEEIAAVNGAFRFEE